MNERITMRVLMTLWNNIGTADQLYFCRNIVDDPMETLYCGNGVMIDICRNYGYFEVFGLDNDEQVELAKRFNKMVEAFNEYTKEGGEE